VKKVKELDKQVIAEVAVVIGKYIQDYQRSHGTVAKALRADSDTWCLNILEAIERAVPVLRQAIQEKIQEKIKKKR
jgi:hypothetical protein